MTGSTCPHCGGALPAEAQFCKHCGEAVELNCHNCGESVPAQANYCPSCRAELRTTPDPSGGAGTGDEALRLQPRELARRIEGSDLGGDGFLAWLNRRKEVEIETGNKALLLENGAHVGSLRPGRHTLESLTKRIANLERKKDLAVVLVEDGDTAVDIAVDDLRTASESLVTSYVELVVAVDDPERFVRSMLADRSAVTAGTFGDILGDAIRDELQATIKEYERDELYGNRELKRDLRQDIERHCRATLKRYGLTMVELRSFDYDDDRDEIREGRKEVEIQKEREELKDERAQVDRRQREREVGDEVHKDSQRVRRQTSKQAAEHEVETHASELDHERETQEIEQEHERSDIERHQEYKEDREDLEHDHELEREEIHHDYDRMDHERDRTDHDEQVKTRRKEGTVERRDLEHEQDTKEIEDLMDLKKKKDMDGLDVREREEDIEMDREEHEVEMEKERLQARDEVDVDTLASLADAEDPVAELAKMEKAGDLTPEQLDALGAQESDELAKARQEAKKAEHERERLEDQKAFREEVREMADDAMNRMQETSESAMDNVAETGKAAAEDTSDNVILSDSGSNSDSGDTTIVQGGGSDSGGGGRTGGAGGAGRAGTGGGGGGSAVACPDCGAEMPADDEFCMQCGTDL